MQMKNNKLDKYRELLVDKLNKKSFPVLYSFAECVRTNNEYSAIIYINSEEYSTKCYRVHPFYKPIINLKLEQ